MFATISSLFNRKAVLQAQAQAAQFEIQCNNRIREAASEHRIATQKLNTATCLLLLAITEGRHCDLSSCRSEVYGRAITLKLASARLQACIGDLA